MVRTSLSAPCTGRRGWSSRRSRSSGSIANTSLCAWLWILSKTRVIVSIKRSKNANCYMSPVLAPASDCTSPTRASPAVSYRCPQIKAAFPEVPSIRWPIPSQDRAGSASVSQPGVPRQELGFGRRSAAASSCIRQPQEPSINIKGLLTRSAMSQLERIYKLDRLLRRKTAPTKREILAGFEISPAQFKRDLDFMRERLGAAITFEAATGGYRYSSNDFNLPGLWFSEPEVYSMLLMRALLDQLQPGVVREQLEPFEAKLRALLATSRRDPDSLLQHMRVTPPPH